MSLRSARALLTRDLRLAARRSGDVVMPLFFLFAVILLIPLGVGPGPTLLARMAPGMIWVAALLSSLLALERLFRPDFDDGTLEQWFVNGSSGLSMVCARLFSHWLLTGLPVIVFSPVAAAMLQLPAHAWDTMLLSLLLGTPALSVLGGLGASLTLSATGTSALLGLLVFPLLVPLLIFATGAISMDVDQLDPWAHLGLLAAISMAGITLAPLAIAAALRFNLE